MIFTEFVAGNFETGISDHLAQDLVTDYGKNKQAKSRKDFTCKRKFSAINISIFKKSPQTKERESLLLKELLISFIVYHSTVLI